MATSFGEQLRHAREARGISLREISEQTRISVRYLEAIEADDYKRLPGGIFNRSFIKAYARHVGFDEKEALDGYTRTAREQGAGSDESFTPHQPRVYTDDDSARSPFVTFILMVLILGVIVLATLGAWHFYNRRVAGRGANAPQQAQKANTVPATAASAVPTPQVVPAGLTVQVKARGDRVWIKAKPDGEPSTQTTLEPDQAQEFKPKEQLELQFAKVKAPVVQLTINGRAAKVVGEPKADIVKMIITKDNYTQFLQ